MTDGTWSGIATGLWLLVLWHAAPIFEKTTKASIASRLRDTVILGVTIPGLLAAANVLYGWTCVAVGLVLVALRFKMASSKEPRKPIDRGAFSWAALPAIAVVAIAWPLVVRPLLDGDSLSYHLPNAAAWVHAHGLWLTDTRYWWYPGGSELFAAGVYAVGGSYGLPLCGMLALMLLALRCHAFALEAALPEPAAACFSLLVTSCHFALLQAGNLENDIWLSAFLIEIVWCLKWESDAVVRTTLLATLVKPVGFLFTLALLTINRVSLRRLAVCCIAIVAWFVRDAVLWQHASISPTASAYPDVATTTIAWHGIGGLLTLVRAIAADGWASSGIAILAIVALVRGEPALKGATLVFTLIFFVEPFGFNNDLPQLATGSSLRYFAPALVLAAIAALPIVRPFAVPFAVAAAAAAIVSIASFEAVFRADAATHGTIVVTALFALVVLVPLWPRARAFAITCVSLALIAYAGRIAAGHPAQYYDDIVAGPSSEAGVYSWLQSARPRTIVARGFSIGATAVVSPGTNAVESVDDGDCARARANRAWLVMVGDARAALSNDARERAKRCGSTSFESANAIVVRPW